MLKDNAKIKENYKNIGRNFIGGDIAFGETAKEKGYEKGNQNT